jgi:DNA polymerase-1
VEEGQISADQRRVGKTINFGVIYGMSAFRLARDMRISRRDADEFIRRYFQRYAGVDRFIKQTISRAEQQGYVETIMGRRRPVSRINSRNRTEKMAAERVAVNSPIQGSAADIVKRAMIEVTRALADNRMESRLLLQVHDELIFEVPDGELDKVRELVKDKMERAVQLSVPLRVSLEVGPTWGDIH